MTNGNRSDGLRPPVQLGYQSPPAARRVRRPLPRRVWVAPCLFAASLCLPTISANSAAHDLYGWQTLIMSFTQLPLALKARAGVDLLFLVPAYVNAAFVAVMSFDAYVAARPGNSQSDWLRRYATIMAIANIPLSFVCVGLLWFLAALGRASASTGEQISFGVFFWVAAHVTSGCRFKIRDPLSRYN